MARQSSSQPAGVLDRIGVGPKLIGVGIVLFVVTRIIRWLPLGFVGSWINGFLWPVLLVCLVAGAGLVYFKARRRR